MIGENTSVVAEVAVRDAFCAAFEGLTGYAPFAWQSRLSARIMSGDLPDNIDFPTGFGKTSVMSIWLIALAHGAPLPRRLFYIVNRRTVVDQATSEAEMLRSALETPAEAEMLCSVLEVRDGLRGLCMSDGNPLAISTLRGEMADNGEWKTDPSRPAIIVGTIDMIGSKLLFSGYGDGRYGRAHHAGLVGRDTLIIHDEAHLTPAFGELLRAVAREQTGPGRIRVVEMTATVRPGAEGSRTFGIEDEDFRDARLVRRLGAVKLVRFVKVDSKAALVGGIVEEAMKYEGCRSRVVVYVKSPETAAKVAQKLQRKAHGRVGLLTGTIRGHERDSLVRGDLFASFKSAPDRAPIENTLYLVSTSAGEVGVDLDADHIVCDLVELDSMLQRFGRVNRLGGMDRADITVVCTEPKSGSALAMTIDALRMLPSPQDASGAHLASPTALDEYLTGATAKHRDKAMLAFSPTPAILPISDVTFDRWSLTSLEGCRDVAAYLHGVEAEPPETYVAWRAELMELHGMGMSGKDMRSAMKAFPLRSAERLRDNTRQVLKQLALMAIRLPRSKALLLPRDSAAAVEWIGLADLAKSKPWVLAHATIILPVEVGGLRDGRLDGKCSVPVRDVAETLVEGKCPRQRVWVEGDQETPAVGDLVPGLVPLQFRSPPDGESRFLEYRMSPKRSAATSAVGISAHAGMVEDFADRISDALGLPPTLRSALSIAARHHDSGKARDIWQRYACNASPDFPVSKSARYLHWRALGGYRHEFGSLCDATEDAEVADHPERDLILHLIAAHHGWARSHFRPQSYDRSRTTADSEDAAREVMRRFGRLQRRFGRWRLAWLESLLRCADAMASSEVQT